MTPKLHNISMSMRIREVDGASGWGKTRWGSHLSTPSSLKQAVTIPWQMTETPGPVTPLRAQGSYTSEVKQSVW